MTTRFSNRDKAIIIGLYLSKFDVNALREFGFDGFHHAFNVLGYSIGVKPASIKNYRDEFDPYFPNERKGWHKRTLRQNCKKFLETFSELQFHDFTEYIKSFILTNYDIEKSIAETIQEDISESVAKRLVTGKAAEEYFMVNYLKTNEFSGYELIDTRMFACGFDFKLLSQSDFYFVEVKGMNLNIGNIAMTEKEHSVARNFRERYCLFVVKNFIDRPNHVLFFNPLESILEFKRHEREIVQISYSALMK